MAYGELTGESPTNSVAAAGDHVRKGKPVKYLRTVRGRLLCLAAVPCAVLVFVAVVIGVFLVRQADSTAGAAQGTADATDRVTRVVAGLQQQRADALRAPDHHAAVYALFAQRIDAAIGDFRVRARLAPDAESGYQETVAAELLTAAEGMTRADALAIAGLDPATRADFAAAAGAYHAEIVEAGEKLTATGRAQYESLTRAADWSTLKSVEDALAAGQPLPVTVAAWRTAAYDVSRGLNALYTQQSQYAVQLTLDSAHRTLGGALAAAAAMVLCAGLVMVVVLRQVARLRVPVIRIPVPDAAIPQPRHARPALLETALLETALDGIRRW